MTITNDETHTGDPNDETHTGDQNDETATGGVCAVILVEKVGKHGGSSVL